MKKRLLAALLAVAVAVSVPASVSAVWQKDESGSWQWSENGVLQTGWKQIDGRWYFFDQNGTMQTGWVKDAGKWYYLDSSGAMKTGWQRIEGEWYHLKSSGAMSSGWVKSNDEWFYMAPATGAMAKGWVTVGKEKYFLQDSGEMQTGLIQVDGKTYYLNDDGAMVTGTVEIDGQAYKFSEKTGEATGYRKPAAEKAFDTTGKTVTPSESSSSAGGGGSTGGGGSSSSGSAGGGSTGGGSTGGNTGGSSGGGSSTGQKYEFYVENGTYNEIAEGIVFIPNEGYYWGDSFYLGRTYVSQCIKINGLRIMTISVSGLSQDISKIFGSMYYYPEDETSDYGWVLASLQKVEKNEETGVITVIFGNFEIGIDRIKLQLKISEDGKSTTLLGFTVEDLIRYGRANIKLGALPNTTATVKSEQEVRDALADPNIDTILSKHTEKRMTFKNQLIINRNIILEGFGSWYKANDWEDGDKALVSIQDGAIVQIEDMSFPSVEVKNSTLKADSIKSNLYLENATAQIINSSITKVRMDFEEDSISTLSASNTTFSGRDYQIVSGSAESIVTLPEGYKKFKLTDEEGNVTYEWCNNETRLVELYTLVETGSAEDVTNVVD